MSETNIWHCGECGALGPQGSENVLFLHADMYGHTPRQGPRPKPEASVCLHCEKPIHGRQRPWSVKKLNGEEYRPFHYGCGPKWLSANDASSPSSRAPGAERSQRDA